VSGTVPNRLADGAPTRAAAAVAAEIPADATLLVSGFGSVGYPKAVPEALAHADRPLSLTVVSGGSVGEEIDVALVEADAIDRRYPYQARRPIRDAINRGDVAFHDRHVAQVGDEVQYGGLVDADVAVVEAVAAGEDWLIPSTSLGQTPAFVEAADALVVEVNHAQPLALQHVHDVYRPGRPPDREPIPLRTPGGRIGSPRIEFDAEKLLGVVESDRRDRPYTFRTPTDDDEAVAANLAAFLSREVERTPVFSDAVRLQFGVGSLGNALMSRLGRADIGDRELVYFGEVIQDGLLDLLDDGDLRSASATSLALSAEGQERFFDRIERYAEDVVLRPTDVSNSPALVDRFGVVAVNSALEVDLLGNANSTHVRGRDVVNGIGGSGDFNRAALVSVVALPSTASGGDLSRIVPAVPHVDHTEHDIDVVVTEQGVADLRGLSPAERAEAIAASCAHPDYRERLTDCLDDEGHVPVDPAAAAEWR
jgi:succinyl-CoA:acetate CoA-transferase